MAISDRFADRLLPETYEGDEPVQVDYGSPESAVLVPEGLFARAQGIARAYDLHLLPTIDIYTKTRLGRGQCEQLLDEIAFLASVSSDPLLLEQLARLQSVISTCRGLPQQDLFIEGP